MHTHTVGRCVRVPRATAGRSREISAERERISRRPLPRETAVETTPLLVNIAVVDEVSEGGYDMTYYLADSTRHYGRMPSKNLLEVAPTVRVGKPTQRQTQCFLPSYPYTLRSGDSLRNQESTGELIKIQLFKSKLLLKKRGFHVADVQQTVPRAVPEEFGLPAAPHLVFKLVQREIAA